MSSADEDTRTGVVICVDFGSTFTKASLVDLAAGRIVASAEHRTTIETDVLDGYDACLGRLAGQDARAVSAPTLACSSAGGGLRIAVVGNEELVTAEAGRRVALSSGGKVVAVFAASRGDDLTDLPACEPDVVLLTGGTDGGNPEPILTCAHALAPVWPGPVVVAGNVDAQVAVTEILAHHPEYLGPLYNGFYYIRREAALTERAVSDRPIPVFGEKDGVVSCRYIRNQINAGAVKRGVALTAVERAALDFLDEQTRRPDLRLDMDLQPGDIQLINNYTILHSRTEFVDGPEPHEKRHMLRLWLKFPVPWPIAPGFPEHLGYKPDHDTPVLAEAEA